MRIVSNTEEAKALNVRLVACEQRLDASRSVIDKAMKLLKPSISRQMLISMNKNSCNALSALSSKFDIAISQLEAQDIKSANDVEKIEKIDIPTIGNGGSNQAYSIGHTIVSNNADAMSIISEKNPPRQIQARRAPSSNPNASRGQGICNISSITTLLNRQYALDNANTPSSEMDYFTVTDALESNGCRNIEFINVEGRTGQERYTYDGGTGSTWYRTTYTNGEGVAYSSHAIGAREARRAVNNDFGGSYEEYVASLLDEHPAGLCMRNNDSTHVAVITGYERNSNGSIQLLINDPVNNYEGPLSGGWIAKNDHSGSVWNDLSSNCAFVYLERE